MWPAVRSWVLEGTLQEKGPSGRGMMTLSEAPQEGEVKVGVALLFLFLFCGKIHRHSILILAKCVGVSVAVHASTHTHACMDTWAVHSCGRHRLPSAITFQVLCPLYFEIGFLTLSRPSNSVPSFLAFFFTYVGPGY